MAVTQEDAELNPTMSKPKCTYREKLLLWDNRSTNEQLLNDKWGKETNREGWETVRALQTGCASEHRCFYPLPLSMCKITSWSIPSHTIPRVPSYFKWREQNGSTRSHHKHLASLPIAAGAQQANSPRAISHCQAPNSLPKVPWHTQSTQVTYTQDHSL